MGDPNGQAMTGIAVHNDHDVLCGRGGGSYKHLGNSTYRHLVNLNKELYLGCKKHEKIKISQAIVAAIRGQDPSGRFLEKDAATGLWYDIGDKKAVEKTSQALREGAPKLRQKLNKSAKEKDGDATSNNSPSPTPTADDIALPIPGRSTSKSPPPIPISLPPQVHSQAPKPSIEGSAEQINLPSNMQSLPVPGNQVEAETVQPMGQFSQTQYGFQTEEEKGDSGLYTVGETSADDGKKAFIPPENMGQLPEGSTAIDSSSGLNGALPVDENPDLVLSGMLRSSLTSPHGALHGLEPRRSMFRNSTHSHLTDYSDMLDSICSFDIDEDMPFGNEKIHISRGSLRASLKLSKVNKKGSLFRGSEHSVLTDFSDISDALHSIQMEDEQGLLEGGRRRSSRYSFTSRQPSRRSAFAINEFAQDKPDPRSRDVATDCKMVMGAIDFEDEEGVEPVEHPQEMEISRGSMKSRGSVRFSLPSSHVDRATIISGAGTGVSSLLRSSILTDVTDNTTGMSELEATEAPVMVWDIAGSQGAKKSSVST